MSQRIRNSRSKSSRNKGKPDPQTEMLESSKKEVQNLREELNNAHFLAQTAEARRQKAYLDRAKSAKTLEDVKRDTVEHTSFLVTEYETAMSNLHQRVHKLEDQVDLCNRLLDERNKELQDARNQFEKQLSERDEYILHLEKELKNQNMLSRDALTRALDRLAGKMQQDIDRCFDNIEPLSKESQQIFELEFSRPPFYDEESTEYQ